MFYANKCISFYFIVLLQLATSAFGTQMKGAWMDNTDKAVVDVNKLLTTQYKQVLHEILETEALSAFITAEAESMIYLEAEGKGKPDRTAVLVMKGTPNEVATTAESDESGGGEGERSEASGASGSEGSEANSASGSEESAATGANEGEVQARFSIVLDYLNLEEGVKDSDRLRVAKDKCQSYTLASTLVEAKDAARAHVEDPGVTIEMRFQLLHAAQKKFKKVSQSVQRALPFRKNSEDSKGGESSGNKVNSANPPSQASVVV